MLDEDARSAILAPIEDGVGIDGRDDEGAGGDLLREVRSQRKALIRQEQALAMGGSATDEGGWDWETLAENAVEYLSQYGKDLEPMAVLIEASVRIEGPEGLSSIMALLADLVEAFWDSGLYPVEDDDGIETRFQPLSGLSGGGSDKDGALILPVRRMVLAQVSGDSLQYIDKVKADAVMQSAQTAAPEQKPARVAEAEEIFSEITGTARRMTRRQIETVAAAIGSAEAGWRRAVGFISERTKPRFPAASRLSDELQGIRVWLSTLADLHPQDISIPEEVPVAEAEVAGGEGVAPATVGGGGGGGFVAGKITRREEALTAIKALTDYFAQYEPLSPLGGTLREVDRRARLSLHELLTELIPDESARSNFYWRSGIRPPTGSGGDGE